MSHISLSDNRDRLLVSTGLETVLAAHDLDALLTSREAAQFLRKSVSTLNNWRNLGKGPPYLKDPGVNGRVYYRLRDLLEWVVRNLRKSTSDPGHIAPTPSESLPRNR
jgi:helix-turn-helix protein